MPGRRKRTFGAVPHDSWENLKAAGLHARLCLQRPLNTSVTIHMGQVVLAGTPADKRREVQKRLRDWLWKQHQVPLTAAWALEAKDRAVHLHIVMHLPCKRNSPYPKERFVRAVREYLVSNIVPDEARPDEMVKAVDRVPWNTDLYPPEPIKAALYYIGKRTKYGTRSGGDQGEVRGKRAGVTPNIDKAAREREFADWQRKHEAAAA